MAAFFRLAVLALCLLPTLAFGQANICINGGGGNCGATYTGTAIGSGQAITNPLFLTPNANLQFGLPMSYAYWVKTTAIPAAANVYVFSANPTASGVGFLSISQPANGLLEMGFNQTLLPQGATAPFSCDLPLNGRMCSLNSYVNDGNFHHVCVVWNVNGGRTYIDGVLRSSKAAPITYTPTTSYWQLGDVSQAAMTFRDTVIAHTSFTGAQCAEAYNRGVAGFSIAGTDLLTSAVSYWPMNPALGTCTGSGLTLACADSIASNNWGADSTGPTCVITSPTTGTLTGDINVTATSTDSITVSTVTLAVDGLAIVNATTSPYTSVFHTAWLKDGTHTVNATCTNVSGVATQATPVTFTSSNSNPGNTYYVTDGTGTNPCNDTNNGTATSTPWCTIARAITGPTGGTSTYNPGDQILFGGGENWTITTVAGQLSLVGPVGASIANVTKAANIKGAWSNGVTVSVFNDGNGVSCIPPTTVTGCATFTVSIPGSVSSGTGFPLYLGAAVQVLNSNGNVVTNIRVVGSGTSQLYCCSQLAGLGIFATSNVAFLGQWVGNTITNNEVLDMGSGIFLGQSSGAVSTNTVSNNTVHVTTPSSTTAGSTFGILCQGACRTATLQGNVVYNINGFPNTATSPNPGGGYTGGCCGNGIAFLNGASGGTMQFNLVHDTGANNNNASGPVALYDFDGSKNTIQFNEAFNALPVNFTVAPGGDNDAIDLDTVVTNDLVQYNYTHNNWGGLTGFAASGWTKNVFRFNISENEALEGTDASGGLTGMGPSPGIVYFYNNTIFNNLNGTQNNGVNTGFIRVGGFGWYCTGSGSVIANNIFALSEDHFGGTRFVIRPNGTSAWCPGETWKANDWYAINGLSSGWIWCGSGTCSVNQTTLAGWQSVVPGGDTGATTANPTFAGTVGGNTQCITATGSTGPGNCPSGYALGGGSTLLGAAYTGLTGAPYNQIITRDYFNNACSGGNVSDIGAAGCQ